MSGAAPRTGAAPGPHGARRDALRVCLRIALRNLTAAPVRTLILGAIVLLGSLIVVVGTSLLDSIDRGMRTSIQGSLGGHLQVYDARSEGDLELYGGLRGESLLEPIEDFARVKEVLAKVPNVKRIVPMGIDQAFVATGTAFDAALELLREDVRRKEGGDRSPERGRAYEAHRAHVRGMLDLLTADIDQARVIADLDSREMASRRDEFQALFRAKEDAFWRDFERDPYAGLEFLENRVAPSALEDAFTFIRYVGTDVDAFFDAFPLAEIAEGGRIPKGQRGILVGKQFAEEWLKNKNARRLDQIKDKRDRRGKKIAKDEELQRWVRDNARGVREILLQLDPLQAEDMARRLGAPLAASGTPLEAPLNRLFATTDDDFDAKYRIFYEVVAPRIRLYKIRVGDTITVKAPSKSGYFSSVNVKVYGFLQFKGIERSGIAGMMSVMDIHSFRDLYGYLTPEKAEEIRRMQAELGAREVSREEAEAALFGGGGDLVSDAKQQAIDESALVERTPAATGPNLQDRVYTREETERGVALNAAVILEDPSRSDDTAKAIRAALDQAGLGYREVKGPDGEVTEKSGAKVIGWQEASGIVGQFVTLLRVVLFTAVVIFFAIALVIINNAMVMATLQRVKEIGTMRAIGTQRRFVVVMLLVEIATVGVLFGVGGALLGGGVVALIRALGGIPATTDMLYFVFSGPALFPKLYPTSVAGSLVVVLLVSILSALYPALLAMRVTPVEAMATEE
jgi:ABC-type lipoprotein release transport system permease subunit